MVFCRTSCRRSAVGSAAPAAVDGWVADYNTLRPHQALGMAVPADRFSITSAQAEAELLPLRLPVWRLAWVFGVVGLDGLEPSTSSLSDCRPRALELRVDSSGAVWMSPECSRLSFMVGCFWHGSGTPMSRRPSDHLIRRYPRGCPASFRSVRDLRRSTAACSVAFDCFASRPPRVAPKMAPSDCFLIRSSLRSSRPGLTALDQSTAPSLRKEGVAEMLDNLTGYLAAQARR